MVCILRKSRINKPEPEVKVVFAHACFCDSVRALRVVRSSRNTPKSYSGFWDSVQFPMCYLSMR